MRYIYLPEATEDVRRLHAFLDDKNPAAAINAMRTIEQAGILLLDNPMIGRRIKHGNGLRQLIIPFGQNAYVMHYRLDDNAIIVTRIWHSREDRE